MPIDIATRINRWFVIASTTIMGIDLALLLINSQWMSAALVTAIIRNPTLFDG